MSQSAADRAIPHWLERWSRFCDLWARRVAVIGLAGFLVQTVGAVIDIVMRWLFNAPIDGLSDVSELVVVFMVAACFPMSLAGRHQIGIKFLGKRLGWPGREILEAWSHLVTFVVFALIGWQLIGHTQELIDTHQTTWLLAIPLWPSWSIATVLMLFCIPVQALVALTFVFRALSPTPLPEPDEGIDPMAGSPIALADTDRRETRI